MLLSLIGIFSFQIRYFITNICKWIGLLNPKRYSESLIDYILYFIFYFYLNSPLVNIQLNFNNYFIYHISKTIEVGELPATLIDHSRKRKVPESFEVPAETTKKAK